MRDASTRRVRVKFTRLGVKKAPAAKVTHAAQKLPISREVVRHAREQGGKRTRVQIERAPQQMLLECGSIDTVYGAVAFAKSKAHDLR